MPGRAARSHAGRRSRRPRTSARIRIGLGYLLLREPVGRELVTDALLLRAPVDNRSNRCELIAETERIEKTGHLTARSSAACFVAALMHVVQQLGQGHQAFPADLLGKVLQLPTWLL